MLVLHAGLCEGRLFLWAETSEPDPTLSARRPGRKPKVPKPTPHPLAAEWEVVGRAVTGVLGRNPGRPPVEPLRALAWLPTGAGRPAPSSALVGPPLGARAECELRPWFVPGAYLGPSTAVDLLCACQRGSPLAPGLVAGPSLAYWTRALRWVGRLTARQRYLPGVAEEEGVWHARWQPFLAGEDAMEFGRLARQMPPSSRCLSGPKVEAAPETAAGDVLRHFVASMLDELVRSTSDDYAARPRRGAKPRPAFASVHDAWLGALASRDGVIEADGREVARLADALVGWRRPLDVAAAAPFGLCFRLEEPGVDDAEAPWCLRYLLQAADDPSLRIDAQRAWKPRGKGAALIRKHGSALREHLLASLGQAACISDAVRRSLDVAEPSEAPLDLDGAYEFLTRAAPALEEAGFPVLLPSWWTGKGTRARLEAKARAHTPSADSGPSRGSLADRVHLNLELALGGVPITAEELDRLAALKAPLVRLRGEWVQIEPGELEAAAAFFRERASAEMSGRDVLQLALGMRIRGGGVPLPIGEVEATGWLGELLGRLRGHTEFAELPVPRSLHCELRPYQARGYSWLAFLRQWGFGACLADDMGLGKTVQTLTLIARDWEEEPRGPVLLVCPTSVVTNWVRETERFAPGLPVMVHHGAGRAKGEAFRERAFEHAIVVSSYALLLRDAELLSQVPWRGVVLDEAQNIKNPDAKQSRAARALPSDYRVALTGTPVENTVGDLWAVMEFLNPGLLPGRTEFRREFTIPIQASDDEDAKDRLKRVTGPFVLRRLKTDPTVVPDLPDKLEMKVYCPLTKEQAGLYAAVVAESEAEIAASDGMSRRGAILRMLTRLKQACNHPAQLLADGSSLAGRSGKLSRVGEMLEELVAAGDRALVFTQYAEMGLMLQHHFQELLGREVPFLYGSVTKQRRDEMVEAFQSEDGPPAFVLSIKAGGTGLNLTRASHVFHYDRWWNPAVENQATDRAYRIGQTRNVQVHKMVCAGTLEERIDEMIEHKRQVSEGVVGTGEQWLTELSNADLRSLVALRKDAVSE